MFSHIREDLQSIKERDPAARGSLQVILLYSGLHAVWAFRLAHWFHLHGLVFLARCISEKARFFTGIEIHPGAKIGRRFFIDHGMGVIIGETSEIGDDCLLYQGVTLGGIGIEHGKRHPTLGSRIVVGAGAKILGNISIGDDTRIGANSVVLHDVPANSTVVGIPGRVVRRYDAKTLSHASLPDPVTEAIAMLNARINHLEAQLKENGKISGKSPLPACEDPELKKILGED